MFDNQKYSSHRRKYYYFVSQELRESTVYVHDNDHCMFYSFLQQKLHRVLLPWFVLRIKLINLTLCLYQNIVDTIRFMINEPFMRET